MEVYLYLLYFISLIQKTTDSIFFLTVYSLIFLIAILISLIVWIILAKFSEIDSLVEEKIEQKIEEKFKIQDRLIDIEKRLYKIEHG